MDIKNTPKSIDGIASRKTRESNHLKPHPLKPANTLMRHSLSKPQTQSLKRKTNVQGVANSGIIKANHQLPAAKLSTAKVSSKRLNRSSQVDLHPKVSRFAQTSHHQNHFTDFNVPTTTPVEHHIKLEVHGPSKAKATTKNIFEEAIHNANSHQEKPVTLKRRTKTAKIGKVLRHRMIGYTTGALVVLGMIGIFGYFNMENLKFQMAVNQAGFSATKPDYQPTGYKLNQVDANNGELSINYVYQSASGSHSYDLTEKPSTWSDHDLIASVVGDSYQTVQQAGRTVYLYDDSSQAAWITSGILYQISSSQPLQPNDVGQIAASM